MSGRGRWAVPRVWLGLAGELAKCGLCSGAVDLLRRVIRHWTERRILGDAVTVVVGGDGAGVPSPRRCLARVARRVTEWPRPSFSGGAGGVEHSAGAGLDQLAPFIEGMPHIGGHRAGGFRDQPGDETRRVACAAGVSGAGGGVGEAVVDDGGDVIGVGEPASLDEAW